MEYQPWLAGVKAGMSPLPGGMQVTRVIPYGMWVPAAVRLYSAVYLLYLLTYLLTSRIRDDERYSWWLTWWCPSSVQSRRASSCHWPSPLRLGTSMISTSTDVTTTSVRTDHETQSTFVVLLVSAFSRSVYLLSYFRFSSLNWNVCKSVCTVKSCLIQYKSTERMTWCTYCRSSKWKSYSKRGK